MARNKLYRIYGKYPGNPWEKIDDAATRRSVYDLLDEYKMAYGPEWKFEIRYGSERWSA